MRFHRPLILSAFAAVLLFLPGCTPVPIEQFSIGNAGLGLQGASATVPVNFTCDAHWNIAYGDTNLAQQYKGRLAQASGGFENDFPGIPCTGKEQTIVVTLFNYSPWAFREGTAAASADLSVYNPSTQELVTKVINPTEIRIVKVTPAPDPVRTARPARDPRYSKR